MAYRTFDAVISTSSMHKTNRQTSCQSRRRHICVVTLLVMLCCPLLLHAQTDESEQLAAAKQRIAELEREVRVLTAKLTLLETQMKNQAQVAAQTATKDDAASTASNSDAKNGGGASNASDQDSASTKREAPVRKFQTLLQPMQLLPAKLRPRMGQGWDRFKKDEAALWFKETYAGDDIFDGRLTIKVSQLPVQQRTVGGVRVQVYQLILYFKAPSFDYIGIPFEPHDFRTTIFVNAETAQAYEKLDPKIPLRVTGKLSMYSASMKYMSEKDGDLRWELQDWKIHSPHLPD